MATHHVIIGGGPAATNAVETIRQIDGDAKITLVSDEPAHSRMALPYWLSGDIPREQTHTADDAYYEKLKVEARIGQRVEKIDPQANSITLSDGGALEYDKLLIATGSSPVSPPIEGIGLPGVQPLWTLAHAETALQAAEGIEKPRVLFVGAGFIGFIVLNALYKRGCQLTVVEREKNVLPRMLDSSSAKIVENHLASKNITVHCGATVTAITASGETKSVQLSSGESIEADLVIVATGIQANLGLLEGSGIKTDQAILVNDRMQTNFPNVYAAGDVAQGPALYSDGDEVHAIQPTAVDHGRVAGANMAGRETHYPGSLLMNIVDICGLQAASFGAWGDASAEALTINNPAGSVYRKLLWSGDQISGAIFLGKPNDMGMLTDVGMVKGIMQTQTGLSAWKKYLAENPFDIRRAYIASGVAQKLIRSTLLGGPSRSRQFHFGGAKPQTQAAKAHSVYVDAKSY